MKGIRKATLSLWERFRRVRKTADHRRNFKVLLFASVLNLSFAVEKVLLGLGIDLGNWVWAGIYGGLALWTTWLATSDYVQDVVEHNHNDTERLL